jgi:hypothetical protein
MERGAVGNGSACDSTQRNLAPAAGSHHLTNFDAHSARHAASTFSAGGRTYDKNESPYLTADIAKDLFEK